jgi:sortase A
MDPVDLDPPRRHRRRHRTRRRLSVLGIIGELLVTAGVLVLLFLGWQLWWNDMIMAREQTNAASDLSEQWMDPSTHGPVTVEDIALSGSDPDPGDRFAIMYVPRFGADYRRVIAEGVGMDVLNSPQSGIGHYPETQMPGEVGNFAIAAHRRTNGGAMLTIEQLRLGDPIYIETQDSWYTYRFHDLEYVLPEGVDVLAPFPHESGADATESIITLTTCNPLFSTDERIIAYGILESSTPKEAGPPADIAESFVMANGG